MSTGRLTGKIALVTGAGRGIGQATALALAAEGAAVAVTDLAGHDETAAQVQAYGGQALALRMDVTDGAQVRAAVARTVERFGGLQILVNNAGVGWPRPLAEISEEEWDRVLAIDLKGPFLCIQAAAPHLAPGSAVVNLASLAGRSSSPLQGCFYSAAKAGLLGLTRHLARELGPSGIRVNAICPGPVDTDLLRDTSTQSDLDRFVASIPLRRLGTPDDIARAIVFLASDDAGYITGAALDANGGIFMA
jgi:NAD(P)-dependent dehydrogenase (short-subunit alcohol dehydrogenase family)